MQNLLIPVNKMVRKEGFCKEPRTLFTRDRTISHPEGYRISINRDGIRVFSSTDAGAFYGRMTLGELAKAYGAPLPCCEIEDKPRFNRRGVYLDCSRGKVPKVSTLKSLITLLSSWKINEVQLYIENVFTFNKHPEIGKGFSPFTPQDLLDIQDHCGKHHVRFVPSLSSFGHMEKTLMLPRYSRLGELPGYREMAGGTTLNPGHPGSLRLITDLYSEFVPLFKAEDFNVCGDEPWELGQGASKARAARIGKGRVYLDFILKLHKLCLRHGKRMNMWADIVMNHPEIIPEIPKDIVQLNWQYNRKYKERRIERSHEITDAGLPLVCCPGTNDWQSHGSRLEQALDVIAYFTRYAVKTDAEGILNTEWGDAGHRNTLAVNLCAFAYGAALSWNPRPLDSHDHVRSFAFHLFGDKSGRMARDLWTLGDMRSFSWAYHAFNESLKKPEMFFHFYGQAGQGRFDNINVPGHEISNHVAALDSLDFARRYPSKNSFLQLMLKEYDLAACMDRIAWERLGLARALRWPSSGGPSIRPPKGGLLGDRRVSRSPHLALNIKAHAEDIKTMSSRFKNLWLALNRPSRLCDNMMIFRKCGQAL